MSEAATNQDEVLKKMTTPELIKFHGHIPEVHHIWTEDGYCLDVHRILSPNDRLSSVSTNINNSEKNNKNGAVDNHKDYKLTASPSCQRILETLESNTNTVSKVPVLINHGLISSSADWVLLGPNKALAYVLCENGYDVWLANARGNTYSKFHKRYSVTDKKFWNFSWHEIGYYDLPAMIDYILRKTGHSELYYIGHSQGTTAFYVMGSERPEYNAKVKGMISLAPVAFLENQRSPLLKRMVHFYNVMEWGSVYCNMHEWFSRNGLQTRILSSFIRNTPGSLMRSFSNFGFYPIAGFGSNQLDRSMLPLILTHFPAGASAKQMIHYSQIIISGFFRKFDYGPTENLRLYGSIQPPNYDLGKVKVPMVIFYSDNDFLTHHIDVQKLVRKLPNVIQIKKIEYAKFNHIDYLWGRDARSLLYNSIVTVLKKF